VGAGIAVPIKTLTVNSLCEWPRDCLSLRATPGLLQFPLRSRTALRYYFDSADPVAGSLAGHAAFAQIHLISSPSHTTGPNS
jgi:hypothetical protein